MDGRHVAMSTDFVPVFFDLETTGSNDGDEIIQIGAIHRDRVFCRYMLPVRMIPLQVSLLTGFTKLDNELHYHGQVRETTPLKRALQDMLTFLGEIKKPVILVGQNCFTFDCRFILKGFKQYALLEEFSDIVQGFTDSLPLFKKYLPGKSSYTQEYLARHILGPNCAVAHEAVADATTLVSIFRKERLTSSQILEFARSLADVVKRDNDRISAKRNLATLQILRSRVTEGMLKKMAEAGLNLETLRRCLDAEGPEGLAVYLSQILENGKPRVTQDKRSLKSICDAVIHTWNIGR